MINLRKLLIMFDLETLGLKTAEAPIVQIGACVVGDAKFGFNRTIKYDNVFADFETIKWWMNQSKEAINSVFGDSESVTVRKAIYDFVNWVVYLKKNFNTPSEEVYLVAHGFDLRILTYTMELMGLELPAPYKNHLDLRSFQREAEWKGLTYDIPEILPRHNALSDATWQANWLEAYLLDSKIKI